METTHHQGRKYNIIARTWPNRYSKGLTYTLGLYGIPLHELRKCDIIDVHESELSLAPIRKFTNPKCKSLNIHTAFGEPIEIKGYTPHLVINK